MNNQHEMHQVILSFLIIPSPAVLICKSVDVHIGGTAIGLAFLWCIWFPILSLVQSSRELENRIIINRFVQLLLIKFFSENLGYNKNFEEVNAFP